MHVQEFVRIFLGLALTFGELVSELAAQRPGSCRFFESDRTFHGPVVHDPRKMLDTEQSWKISLD